MNRELLLRGYVLVEISGFGKERFFNLAAHKKLSVWEISEKKISEEKTGQVSFLTTPGDFKKMKPLAKKASVTLRIRKKWGPPFFFYRNRKRKLFFAGALCFFLLLHVLSLFIWDISIEGNRRFTDDTLLSYLETLPVACGMHKKEISCSAVEEALRSRFSEITWASAEIRGTRLILRIRENEAMLHPKEEGRTPCNLAAENQGVINRVVMRSGISMVKAGDAVEKGQILVSGMVPIFDDSGALVRNHVVHADADVYAKTTRVFQKQIPALEHRRSLTGRERKGVFLEAFGHSLCFLAPARPSLDTAWEYLTKQTQLRLTDHFYLPVYLSSLTAREYISYEKYISKEEARTVFLRYLDEYLGKLKEKGIQILGNDVRIEKNGFGWRASCTITTLENIACEVPIPEGQEEIQTVNECN